MICAEIISIGDELTSGQRLDTNSQWLSLQLGELGIRTLYHTTIGDDLQANIDVFRIAAARADIVLCTGGLGPTADDLTRESMATAFDRPLKLDEASLQHIENLFSKRKRAMPERNRVQAYFPEGSQVIPNPHGSAPGIDLEVNTNGHRCRFFAFPGVPAEMKQMWEQTVLQRLRSSLGIENRSLFYKCIKLFGIGESDVEAKLPDLIHRDRIPRVGITVSQATITLRIATEAKDQAESDQIIAPTRNQIYEAFHDLIFGEGELDLQDALMQLIQSKQESLSVIEIGSEGVIGRWMTRVDQSIPRLVRATLVFPSATEALDWMRSRKLNTEVTINSPGEFSNDLASQLAATGRREFASDWCLVVGTYPNYEAISKMNQIPMASVCIAMEGPGESKRVRNFELGAHPDVLFDRIAKTGIDQMRRELLGIKG